MGIREDYSDYSDYSSDEDSDLEDYEDHGGSAETSEGQMPREVIDEEGAESTINAGGIDDGSSFEQPRPSTTEMFDQQPDIVAAIEDKPRLPDDNDDEITQAYPQVHQDEDSSHLANASQYARPQTADLVQALKAMRRSRERKKHMKVSESKKK